MENNTFREKFDYLIKIQLTSCVCVYSNYNINIYSIFSMIEVRKSTDQEKFPIISYLFIQNFHTNI